MDIVDVLLAKILASKTAGSSVNLSIDDEFKLSAILKNKKGEVISTSDVVDLPLEATVVGGSYNSANQSLILTLQNGNTIEIPVSDLISGLVNETSFNDHVNSVDPHPNEKTVRYNDDSAPQAGQVLFTDEAENYVTNGDFSDGLNDWIVDDQHTELITVGDVKAISTTPTGWGSNNIFQAISIVESGDYIFRCKVMKPDANTGDIWISGLVENQHVYAASTSTWNEVEIPIPNQTAGSTLNLGVLNGTIYITDIRIIREGADDMRVMFSEDDAFALLGKLSEVNFSAEDKAKLDGVYGDIITSASFSNGTITLTQRDGGTVTVSIVDLINGLITSKVTTEDPNTGNLSGESGDICYELVDGNLITNSDFKTNLEGWTTKSGSVSADTISGKTCADITYNSSYGYDMMLLQRIQILTPGRYVLSYYRNGKYHVNFFNESTFQVLYHDHGESQSWVYVEEEIDIPSAGIYSVEFTNGNNQTDTHGYFTGIKLIEDAAQPSHVWRHDGTEWVSVGYMTQDEPSGGGSSYTAGEGISIVNNVISLDLEEAEGQSV